MHRKYHLSIRDFDQYASTNHLFLLHLRLCRMHIGMSSMPLVCHRRNPLAGSTFQNGPFGVAEWAVLNGHTARFEMLYGPFGRTLLPT